MQNEPPNDYTVDTTTTTLPIPSDIPYYGRMTLDMCIQAWQNAKEGKSGSQKTKRAYQDTLANFRGMLKAAGKDLDSEPAIIAPLAQGWAALPWQGETKQGKKYVSSATYNQRLSVLSSFYIYAIKNEVLSYNPIERVDRHVVTHPNKAKAVPDDVVSSGLESADRDTPEGQRAYAILAVMLETGRRVSEIAGLRYGHLTREGDTVQVFWIRCKGNKQMLDTLTEETTAVLYDYLHMIYGADLENLPDDAPVWVSFSDRTRGKAIKTQTIQRICETYFHTSKAHATRHKWAKTMHQEGATLAEIGAGLGHSNLATTSSYMEELLGNENKHAGRLARRFGIHRAITKGK